MSRVGLAWKIFKLKCVRAMLRPLVSLHTCYLLKDQNKMDNETINKRKVNRKKTDMQGPDAMMEHLIAKARRKNDKL